MMSTYLPDLLTKLEQVADQIQGLDADREAVIRAARGAGASWWQIGEAMGLTKQAVWERYRHLDGVESA